MNENSYLLFIPQGNVKAIQDKLKDLGGFYNGLGYAIPLKHESFLQKLLANLPKSKIHKLPLSPGQSFSSLQQSYKAAWFQEKLVEIDQKLISLRSQYQLADLSEKTMDTLSSEKKRNIVELLQEKEKIKNSLEHAIGMEKTLSIPQETELTLEFINERSINYLLDEAPETPRLINYLDEGVPKPFIRKGITAMLVGAGGTGKTHILTQLGLAIAMGGNWLDIYPVERPGYVFLGLGENSEQDIHRLLRKTVKSLTRKWPNKNLFDPDPLVAAGNRLVVKSFTGMDASFIRQGLSTGFYHTLFHGLKMKEPKEGWSCIILDPISRFLGADAENDNASATQFIALLEKFSIDLRGNPTVIFGHHMNKSGVSGIGTDQSAARGSSALTDGVRWQANLERVKKQDCKETDEQYELHQISMRPVKSNFTVMLPSQKLEKDEMGCLHALNIAPRPISVGRRSSNGK